MTDEPNHARAFLARLIAAYEVVALCERWLSLDEARREAEREKSQEAATAATARMLELEREVRDVDV